MQHLSTLPRIEFLKIYGKIILTKIIKYVRVTDIRPDVDQTFFFFFLMVAVIDQTSLSSDLIEEQFDIISQEKGLTNMISLFSREKRQFSLRKNKKAQQFLENNYMKTRGTCYILSPKNKWPTDLISVCSTNPWPTLYPCHFLVVGPISHMDWGLLLEWKSRAHRWLA